MKKIPALLLILFAVAAGAWLGTTQKTPAPLKPDRIQGAIYPTAKELKGFELQDQHKQKFSREDLLHHWSLIFVGYTHCPDVCPTTLAIMSKIDKIMREQDLQPPQIIFLTIDPERDTSEVIKPYIEYFNQNFIGLTGPLDEISRFTLQLNAVFRKSAGAGGEITADNYLMDHSSALMLINPDGDLQSILTAPHSPGIVLESILKSQTYYEFNHKE
ncbi:Cytochrome oxidase biogenesis protein Sco1/SenC/PrrC, thiol-disulfide reductase involved in Cu(I) insertion into CoxII Cu(A) center [hydrothermal vent metagenome]|uniref:Cytochrome oxidase biogenesis protein Sco1/SenC/PrrC, thiol-disulfide reductase involved in Cu(I) insertion into CoxII Cu(A) center n=1 Tax=hydrothermal vent metagenome TaxID=652676 RepID=A0A3B0XXX7_9ZZZZ